MRRIAVGVLAAFATLTGCKGDERAVAPTTSIRPTTSTTSVAEGYRQQYLDNVAAANCAGARFDAATNAVAGSNRTMKERDWPRIQAEVLPALKAYADALIAQFQAFASQQWPTAAQEDVRILVRLTTSEASAATTIAQAKSFREFIDAPQLPEGGAEQAAAIRAILGLPTNLVDDGYDWCAGAPRAASLVPSTTTTTATTPTAKA